MMISEDNYLVHYGVKGMKWGIRKDRVSSRQKRYAKRAPERKSVDKIKKVKKSPKNMTNRELAESIARYRLEVQYKDLARKADHPYIDMARSIVIKNGNQIVSDEIKKAWKG